MSSFFDKIESSPRVVFFFLIIILPLLMAGLLWANVTDGYVVVIDPGHGGKYIPPRSIYGDKYNPVVGHYADAFRSGAYSKGLHESEEVFKISRQVKNLLQLTRSADGRKKFRRILRKYSPNAATAEIKPITVHLSRSSGYKSQYAKIKEDVNAPYRLYDYPHVHTGEIEPGRLSKMNALAPHLVVSVHLNGGGNPKNGAVGAVVTPSYHTFQKAIQYVRASATGRAKIEKEFKESPWRNWMDSCGPRTAFENFLCDAWIYFTGYWSKKNGLSPNLKIFRGYRHNQVSWRYADKQGWVTQARRHRANTPYARQLKTFNPKGNFWAREKAAPEKWRREGGIEGYGGDNLYAANEILRYVRKGLLVNKVDKFNKLPKMKKPFLSTWTVPTYVNAVSAFLEIGYLSSSRDYQRVLWHKKTYAESIAVGIYSLLYSLKQPGSNKGKDLPLGRPINFAKYKKYFKQARL